MSSLLVLPGTSGNYASAPDSGPLSVTSDITVLARVALDDWTPATESTIVAKSVATGNQRSYVLAVLTDGTLLFALSQGGTGFVNGISSVAPPVSNGQALWVLASWRNSDNRCQFFTAPGTLDNPSAGDFTQLGTDQTVSATGIFNSTASLEVGSRNGGTALFAPGKYYRTKIYNGVFSTAAFGGTLQFDADFAAVAVTAIRTPSTFTESSANAATVTVNGAAWEWQQVLAGTQVSEADTATAGVLVVARPGTQVTESDTANAGTSAIVVAGSQATTTDTAFGGVVVVAVVGSQTTETDTANPGGAVTSVAGSQASETDTAAAGVATVAVAGTQATEADSAASGASAVVLAGSQVSETDTANAGSTTTGLIVTGAKATETDTANGGTPAATVAGSLAAEVDSVFAGLGIIRWPGTQATETDSVFGGVIVAAVAGERATETDSAFSRTIRDVNPRHVTYTEPSFAIVHQETMVTHRDTAELVYQEG